jgi:hypothetical protein
MSHLIPVHIMTAYFCKIVLNIVFHLLPVCCLSKLQFCFCQWWVLWALHKLYILFGSVQQIINLFGCRSDVCMIPLTTSLGWTLKIHVHVHNNKVYYPLLICTALSDRKATISDSVSLFLSRTHSPVSHMHGFCITTRRALYDYVPSSTSEQSCPKSRLTLYHMWPLLCIWSLQGYDTVWSGRWLPAISRSILPPASG